MKIAILGDLHFGVKNNDRFFLDMQINFIKKQFIPYLKDNNINFVIQLGDFFDQRRNININTYFKVIDVLKYFNENDIKVKTIIGNHDTYYKNKNDVNTPSLLLSDYIDVVGKVEEVVKDGVKFLLVPWINNENFENSINKIKNSDATYCLGHFDISGFYMSNQFESKKGLKKDLFAHFDTVFSGHFHIPQTESNIEYVGTPYQLTWGDYNTPKRFIVLDTKTGEFESIENEKNIYLKLNYSDEKDFDFSVVKNKIVRIFVDGVKNRKKVEEFMEKVYGNSPAKAELVDLNTYFEEINEEYVEIEEIHKLIKKVIKKSEYIKDKKKVYNTFIKLFSQAQKELNLEDI